VLNVTLRVPSFVTAPATAEQEVSTLALVDTGASITAISAEVAARLGLQPADKIPVQGAHGVEECSVYSVDFTFDGSQFWVANKWVCGMANPAIGSVGMLVGRDVLSNMYFTYDGCTGECTMEIPSPSHPDRVTSSLAKQLPNNPPQISPSEKKKEKRRKQNELAKKSRKRNR